MPIIINEIIITTNIEKGGRVDNDANASAQGISMDDMVKQAVEKIMEILEEKKQR